MTAAQYKELHLTGSVYVGRLARIKFSPDLLQFVVEQQEENTFNALDSFNDFDIAYSVALTPNSYVKK